MAPFAGITVVDLTNRLLLRVSVRALHIGQGLMDVGDQFQGRRSSRRFTGWPSVIDPEPPGLGPAAARIEHRKRCVVSEQLGRGENMGGKPRGRVIWCSKAN
jgi:hypothetical protein